MAIQIQFITDKIKALENMTKQVNADILARRTSKEKASTQNFTEQYSQHFIIFTKDCSDYLGTNMPRPLKAQFITMQNRLNGKAILDTKQSSTFVAPLPNSSNFATLEDKVKQVKAPTTDDVLLQGRMKAYIQAFKALNSAMETRLKTITKADVEPSSVDKILNVSMSMGCSVS